jgi:hypothetical protein
MWLAGHTADLLEVSTFSPLKSLDNNTSRPYQSISHPSVASEASHHVTFQFAHSELGKETLLAADLLSSIVAGMAFSTELSVTPPPIMTFLAE